MSSSFLTTTTLEAPQPTEPEALEATLLLQREKEELDAQEAALLREADALQREADALQREEMWEMDGLVEVLNTARGLQRALVGGFPRTVHQRGAVPAQAS
jgi:hypothetical protein